MPIKKVILTDEDTIDTLHPQTESDVVIMSDIIRYDDILKVSQIGTIEDSGISINDIVEKSDTQGLLRNDGTIDTTHYGTYSKPNGGIPATDLATGVIPIISTNITSDATSDTKTTSPKAVKTFVEGKNYEPTSNKVTSISSTSTDAQYPSAKCVYDIVGNIETLLAAI